MILKEYLRKSHDLRHPPELDCNGQPNQTKLDISENIRTEYEYLSRRLKMLFGRSPSFAHPSIDWERDTKKEITTIDDPNQEDSIYRIVSIFWYVIFLCFEKKPNNKQQIEKGEKIIFKTASKKFSNDNERKKAYLRYFADSRIELSRIYNYFKEKKDYCLIPQDIVGLLEYQIELIKQDEYLLEINKNTQKSIDIFFDSIVKDANKALQISLDGYAEETGSAYESKISASEEDLFSFLIDVINDRNTFDSKRLHNDLTTLDNDDIDSIWEKITAILKNDGIGTLNRYIQAKNRKEFDQRLEEVYMSLKCTASDKLYNKFVRLYDLLGRLEEYDVSDADLIKYEKYVKRLIDMLEKYEKKSQGTTEPISSNQEYKGFIETILSRK